MPSGQATQPAATTASRYSTRKRAAINYAEDLDIDMDSMYSDEEEESQEMPTPKPKKQKTPPKPKPLPKKKVFPFMDLPAEIRNQIYSLCLIDPAGIWLCSVTKSYRRTVFRLPEASYRFTPDKKAEWKKGVLGHPFGHISSINSSSNNNNSNNQNQEENGNEKEKGGEEATMPAIKVHALVPTILAVNKQIYHETHKILYNNDFYVSDTLAMHSFLVEIGPRVAALLKRLTLIAWGEGRGVHKAFNHAAFMAFRAATNLERFEIHGLLGVGSLPTSLAMQFYRDAFPWLEAVGAAKGEDDAAVDVIHVCGGEFVSNGSWRTRRMVLREDFTQPQMKEFRDELRRLLNKRTEMIRR